MSVRNVVAIKERKMSWSVNASGTPAEVRGQLSTQFKVPLAEGDAGLSDLGEKQSVQQVSELLEQVLTTFDPENTLAVSASGHMGYSNYEKKTGAYQAITIIVGPAQPSSETTKTVE
jgi:1-aminocyclopropane-1-carboxylate deaminase/D-cysteine desulfhydrase-like pyridoxal-dependent ACC family enzyme